VTVRGVSAIETLSVDPIDVSHASGQVRVGGLNKKVIVAGHQTIVGNPGVAHIHNILEKISKGKTILFLFEDGLTPSASVHNMVPCVGVLNSQRCLVMFLRVTFKKLSQEQTSLHSTCPSDNYGL